MKRYMEPLSSCDHTHIAVIRFFQQRRVNILNVSLWMAYSYCSFSFAWLKSCNCIYILCRTTVLEKKVRSPWPIPTIHFAFISHNILQPQWRIDQFTPSCYFILIFVYLTQNFVISSGILYSACKSCLPPECGRAIREGERRKMSLQQ